LDTDAASLPVQAARRRRTRDARVAGIARQYKERDGQSRSFLNLET
jgi:hypothetical protein